MEKTLDQRFGETLRALREAASKTQEDFSIGRTYLSELERGLKTPTLETIVRLAKELETDPATIVAMATAGIGQETPTSNSSLTAALSGGVTSAATHAGRIAAASFKTTTTLAAVHAAAECAEIDTPRLLAEAALAAFRNSKALGVRKRRQGLSFLLADKRPEAALQFAQDGDQPGRSFPPLSVKR